MKWSIDLVGTKLEWGSIGPGTRCGARSHTKALPSPPGVNTARLGLPSVLSRDVRTWGKAETGGSSFPRTTPSGLPDPTPGTPTLGK